MILHRWAHELPIGIAFVDRSGDVAEINPALSTLLGSRSATDVFPALARFIESPAIRSYLANPTDSFVDSGEGGPDLTGPETARLRLDPQLVEFLDADDRVRFAELSAGPLAREAGVSEAADDAALVVSVQDVTERELTRSELSLTKESLEINRVEIEQFAYVISHDLREPLRKVSSFCGLIEDHLGPSLDEIGKKYLDFAVDGSQRMKDMIDALLLYSRIRPTEDSPSRISVAECVDKARDQLTHLLLDTDARVETGTLPEIDFDQSRLIQIFMHLIENAVRFRGEPSPVIRIEASRDKDDSGWLLEVGDNGIGIEAARHGDVFEIFKRLHSRKAYPGTGIGLSLCKRIIDQRGGEIRIVERPGPGTTVLISVPDLAHEFSDQALSS